MRYLLDKYGEDIDVLYSHNDGMTLGAIDAIREYGLSPGSDIIIITVDGEQAAIDLLKAGEILGLRLCSIHNLRFLTRLMEEARAAIEADRYGDFRAEFIRRNGENRW